LYIILPGYGLIFISALLKLIGEKHEGYTLRVVGVIYWPMRNLYSYVLNLSCLVNCHLVLKIYWCVHHVVSKVSHLLLVVDSSFRVLVPHRKPLIIQARF
jgi:hypothetical protein